MPKVKNREKAEVMKKLDGALAAGDRMKKALVRAKDAAENLADDEKVSPSEYAEDKVQYAVEDMSRDVTRLLANQGSKLAHKGRETLLDRRKEAESHYEEAFEAESDYTPPVQTLESESTEQMQTLSKVASPTGKAQPEPTYRAKEISLRRPESGHRSIQYTAKQSAETKEQGLHRKEIAIKPASSHTPTEQPVPKTVGVLQRRTAFTKSAPSPIVGETQANGVQSAHSFQKLSTVPLDNSIFPNAEPSTPRPGMRTRAESITGKPQSHRIVPSRKKAATQQDSPRLQIENRKLPKTLSRTVGRQAEHPEPENIVKGSVEQGRKLAQNRAEMKLNVSRKAKASEGLPGRNMDTERSSILLNAPMTDNYGKSAATLKAQNGGLIGTHSQGSGKAEIFEEPRSQVLSVVQRQKPRIKAERAIDGISRKASRAAVRTPKRAIKTAEQTAYTTVKTAKATAKAAQKSALASAKAAKMSAQAAKAAKAIAATIKAIADTKKALIAAIAAGGWVALVAIVIICLIGLIATSPFGIFFAGNNRDTGAVTVSVAVAQVNFDFNAQLESLQDGGYDSIDITGAMADWTEVLAVFAVKVAGSEDVGAMDVATLDPERVEKLKEVFWDMNAITSEVETIAHPDSDPDDGVDDSWTEQNLHIIITAKTVEEMRTEYNFTEKQKKVLDELLENRTALLELIGDLEFISADAEEVLQNLPEDLSEERREVIKTACSLVGKVAYFWGGKSLVLGWDSRWGTIQKVWAVGSSTTGTYRSYGLDCSGFVDWVFYNVSDGAYVIGHGGGAAMQHSYCTSISWADALPGDLVFCPEDSHIGIVGGWDDDGNLLIIHCASGYDGTVITGTDGFTSIGRPIYFTE